MSTHYDATIIGAGPAGIAAAIELADAGWKVLLLEKAVFPREKTCGGFIGPENKELFERYGLLDQLLAAGARKVSHIFLSAPNGEHIHVPLSFKGCPDFGLGLSRKVLDEILLARAVQHGVVFKDSSLVHSVTRRSFGGSELRVKDMRIGSDGTITTSQLIYANGAPQGVSSGSRLFGVSGLFRSQGETAPDVTMHFIDHGHAGINNFEEGLTNVCYVVQEKLFKTCQGRFDRLWDHLVAANPCIDTQMHDAKLVRSWKGTFIDLNSPLRFYDGQAFYVGDAAGLIHPVAGGGISIALNTGILLGQLMARQSPNQLHEREVSGIYERLWRKHFQRMGSVSRIIGDLSHRAGVANVIVKFLQMRESTVHNLFDIMHKEAVWIR